MILQVEVDVPESAVDKSQLENHLRKEAILSLFADRKIPAGAATRALGLTRRGFMDLLQQRGIPHTDYTIDDYDQDMKTIDALWPEIDKNVKEFRARGLK